MRLKRIGMLLLTLVLLFSVCSVAAFADDAGSITVEAAFGGKAIPGMSYKLYKVADVDEYGKVTPTAKAAALPVRIPAQISQDEAWVTAFNSLASLADRLDQAGSGSTNAQGGLVFSGVSSGIYLILGESITLDGKVYTAAPAWAQVPVPTTNPRGWDFNPVVKPKLSEADGPRTLQVVIKWDDAGLTQYRPTNVDVELYDGSTKSDEQNVTNATWTHTWTGLDPAGSWDVEELVPEGYKIISKTVEGNVITITNKPYTVITDPPIQKLIEGTGYPGTSRFSFRLEVLSYPDGVTPIPMPEGSTEEGGRVKVVTLNAEQAIQGHEFGEIELHKKGRYVYRLSELAGSEAGYAYDTNSYTLTVELSYGANGAISKTETITDSQGNTRVLSKANPAIFTNRYTPNQNVSLSLGASKIIKGSPKTTADFEFRLVGKSGAPMPSGTTGSQKTVKVHGQGSASFGAITYGAPGRYVYELSEVNAKLSGYTYDTTVYTVTVDVTQKTDGTLSVDVSAVNNHKQSVRWDELVFTNTYKEPPPQTGILWWPVPVLLAGGLLLTFAGLLRRKHES